MRHSMLVLVSACALIIASLTACQQDDSEEITVVRSANNEQTPAASGDVSAAERFGFRRSSMGSMGMGGQSGAQYTADAPEGWQKRPPSSMRPLDYQVAGDPNAEAYFAVLGGTGGGLVANINRWRKQMGLPDLTEQEVQALPTKELVDYQATYVTMDGAFSGMGSESQENFRLLGLVAIEGDNAYFAKMTGPAPVLEGQEENFLNFAASITEGGSADPHAGMDMSGDPHAGIDMDDPHAGMAGMPGMDVAANATTWQWEAPEAWTKAPDRPMRLTTYVTGPENKNEVYIAELPGAAGGTEANINRWQQQMGQQTLSPEQLDALPKVTVAGQEVPMVEINGTFSDGMRGGTFPDYTMYGVVAPVGASTLFIKMTGPQGQMAAEKDNFINFVQSITQAE